MTEPYANLWLEGYKSARFRGKHFVKSFNSSFFAEISLLLYNLYSKSAYNKWDLYYTNLHI